MAGQEARQDFAELSRVLFSPSPLVHFSIANRLGFAWLTSCPKLITALTQVVKYNPVEQQAEAG